jgi:hypothetical protein
MTPKVVALTHHQRWGVSLACPPPERSSPPAGQRRDGEGKAKAQLKPAPPIGAGTSDVVLLRTEGGDEASPPKEIGKTTSPFKCCEINPAKATIFLGLYCIPSFSPETAAELAI